MPFVSLGIKRDGSRGQERFLIFGRPQKHSTALIAVRPSFSAVRCKILNIFIKVCYSLPCLSKPIRVRLPCPLLEDPTRAGNGTALSVSLPLSPIESYRLPTPTP